MKRLLIITQKVDESDDLLGFFVSWIAQFAKHFDAVDVITLGAGQYHLPDNVHVYSLGKERGVAKWQQGFKMADLLRRLVPSSTAVFAHMSPVFAITASPFTMVWRKKLILWYLHRSNTLKLRTALALSDALVTADAASLTIKSPKILSVGHGIDVARFATHRDWSAIGTRPLRILSVGRLSPIKDFETLIQAAGLLRDRNVPIEMRIVGKAVMAADAAYEQKLTELVVQLHLSSVVKFVGFVPYRDIASQYAWADIVVGGTPKGGIDKVILEGMAAGCVAITTNEVMAAYLKPYADQLVVPHGNPVALADALAVSRDWSTVSAAMVASVQKSHNIEHVITAISALA